MTGLQCALTKFFIDKCTKSSMKRKAKVDENGNLVLKESKITIFLSIILFAVILIPISFLVFIDTDSEERAEMLVIGLVIIISFIVLFIYLVVSKKIITNDSIISCGLLGKKNMKFVLIDSVQYKSSGNRLILRENGKKIMIPIMIDGFNDFFEILQKKIGKEKCKNAKNGIDTLLGRKLNDAENNHTMGINDDEDKVNILTRILARLIDIALPLVISLVSFFDSDTLNAVGGLAIMATSIIQIFLLSSSGQTIGKKILKIKVVRVDTNTNGGFSKNFVLREFINTALYITAIYAIADIVCIFRKDRRCVHDLIAGTKVVKA